MENDKSVLIDCKLREFAEMRAEVRSTQKQQFTILTLFVTAIIL